MRVLLMLFEFEILRGDNCGANLIRRLEVFEQEELGRIFL